MPPAAIDLGARLVAPTKTPPATRRKRSPVVPLAREGVVELDRELVRIARTCDGETEPGGGFGRVTYRFHVMKDTRELGTLFED